MKQGFYSGFKLLCLLKSNNASMRHGYGGKYLKELHKSALCQGQGFEKDASKFGKGIFLSFV